MKNTAHQNSITGAAGEYLILSNLLRLNLTAGKVPDNTKHLDIMCFNKNRTAASLIQVKTTMKKESKSNWMFHKKHETPIKNLFFCFVRMQADSSKNEIYVIDSETVAHVAKMSHQIFLKIPGLKGQKHNDSDVRKLHRNHKSILGKLSLKEATAHLTKSELEFLDKYSEGWLDQYRDAWYLLENYNI